MRTIIVRGALWRWVGVAAVVVVVAIGAVAAAFNHAYITTPSMYPTIPPGSLVFIEEQPAYHPGEIIEFRANGLLWIHRLIGIRSDGSLITKGDNPQNKPDVFVPETRMSDVVGKVVLSIPFLGFPELALHHPAYALAWFKAELGTAGRVVLFLFMLGSAALLFRAPRRHSPGPSAEDPAAQSALLAEGRPSGGEARSTL